MRTENFFNEIVYVIEGSVVKYKKPFSIKINGFVGQDNKLSEDKFYNLRKYVNGKIYVFTDLVNFQAYSRKEAFDVLGPCILSTAIENKNMEQIPDLEKINHTDMQQILENSIPIWKSETSRYFVLASNLGNCKVL